MCTCYGKYLFIPGGGSLITHHPCPTHHPRPSTMTFFTKVTNVTAKENKANAVIHLEIDQHFPRENKPIVMTCLFIKQIVFQRPLWYSYWQHYVLFLVPLTSQNVYPHLRFLEGSISFYFQFNANTVCLMTSLKVDWQALQILLWIFYICKPIQDYYRPAFFKLHYFVFKLHAVGQKRGFLQKRQSVV